MNPNSAQPHDNYDAFLSRLDAATSSLSTRAASLDKAWQPFPSSWDHLSPPSGNGNDGAITSMNSSPSLRVAAVLHSAVRAPRRGRKDGINAPRPCPACHRKLAVMQGRREAIDKSLLELELSRIKLTSSRMLSQDREKLSSIFSEIAGSTAATGAIPDMGLLGDLKEAREAIILAEALMEVKGY